MLGYIEGEYQLKRVNPSPGQAAEVAIPGTYVNVSIAFDARMVSGGPESFVAVQCRRQPATDSRYVVRVLPQPGAVGAARVDDGTERNLVPRQAWPAIRPGTETNHIEVNCVGTTISARINGVEVLSVEDPTYKAGQLRLAAGALAAGAQPTDVRIDNLAVTER